jgi:hypothetical protein
MDTVTPIFTTLAKTQLIIQEAITAIAQVIISLISLSKLFPQVKGSRVTPSLEKRDISSQKSDFPLGDEILSVLAKYPKNIKKLPYSITVYWPIKYLEEGQSLIAEMTHKFGGVTCSNNFMGTWENEALEIIPDDLLLIKAFSNAEGMKQHLEECLNRVIFWGSICEQMEMAVEISNMKGSQFLLIPVF